MLLRVGRKRKRLHANKHARKQEETFSQALYDKKKIDLTLLLDAQKKFEV